MIIKKLVAATIAIQLICPVGLFAQQTKAINPEEVEILLDKPAVAYKPISTAIGAGTMTVSAMAAFVGGTEKRLAYLKNRPLDAMVDNVLEMMHIMQRDRTLIELNPTLEREVSEAFFALRRKYDMLYMREPLKYQEIPSVITNKFVFALEKVRFAKNDSYAARFKELIKEADFILGRKQSVKHAGGAGGTIAMVAVVAIGSAISLFLVEDVKAEVISTSRVQYTRALKTAKEKGPQLLALTALELGARNKKLVADIIAGDNTLYPAFKNQINKMTSKETVNTLKNLFKGTPQEAVNKANLVESLQKQDAKELKINYSF